MFRIIGPPMVPPHCCFEVSGIVRFCCLVKKSGAVMPEPVKKPNALPRKVLPPCLVMALTMPPEPRPYSASYWFVTT